jgi:sugar transferase (PEP-CTERM/EpsH1 system associated)
VNIAFVTPYLPYPPDTGGKIRTFYLLKALSRDHRADLFTVYSETRPEYGAVLAGICRSIHLVEIKKAADSHSPLIRSVLNPLPRLIEYFHSPDAVSEVRECLREGYYDLLVLDEICMAPYLMEVQGPKLVIRHKIDHLHYREIAAAQPVGMEKLVSWLEVRKLRKYEHLTMSAFNGAVCCSEGDAEHLHQLNPEIPVRVIGNGVDLEYFAPVQEVDGPPTLLYTGTMHYYPNIDAVQYFFQEIYPHLVRLVPEVRILIVGHGPPADVLQWQRLLGVKITGSVLDIRPYLANCTATIVPLRLGGGTRLKIMESIAAGRPVVSTSIGAQGLGMRHGEHLLVANEPVEFARQSAQLLMDGDLRRRLVAQARPFVVAHFSWEALGEKFETVCCEVAEKGSL